MRFLWLFLCWLALPLGRRNPGAGHPDRGAVEFCPFGAASGPRGGQYLRPPGGCAQRQNPFGADPFFREFFQRFWSAQAPGSKLVGLGCDTVGGWDHVVSNYHVVGQATDIRVVLQDRREFAAQVLLADEESDLAILQLQGAGDMPFLPLKVQRHRRSG